MGYPPKLPEAPGWVWESRVGPVLVTVDVVARFCGVFANIVKIIIMIFLFSVKGILGAGWPNYRINYLIFCLFEEFLATYFYFLNFYSAISRL